MEKRQQVGAEKMRELAAMIQAETKGLGFCLLVYPFNERGMSNYISNSDRGDMTLQPSRLKPSLTKRLANRGGASLVPLA